MITISRTDNRVTDHLMRFGMRHAPGRSRVPDAQYASRAAVLHARNRRREQGYAENSGSAMGAAGRSSTPRKHVLSRKRPCPDATRMD
jgi:hypothetical protein